jgi:hypothetical protein
MYTFGASPLEKKPHADGNQLNSQKEVECYKSKENKKKKRKLITTMVPDNDHNIKNSRAPCTPSHLWTAQHGPHPCQCIEKTKTKAENSSSKVKGS